MSSSPNYEQFKFSSYHNPRQEQQTTLRGGSRIFDYLHMRVVIGSLDIRVHGHPIIADHLPVKDHAELKTLLELNAKLASLRGAVLDPSWLFIRFHVHANT